MENLRLVLAPVQEMISEAGMVFKSTIEDIVEMGQLQRLES